MTLGPQPRRDGPTRPVIDLIGGSAVIPLATAATTSRQLWAVMGRSLKRDSAGWLALLFTFGVRLDTAATPVTCQRQRMTLRWDVPG